MTGTHSILPFEIERKIYEGIQAEDTRIQKYRQQSTPQQAEMLGSLFRQFPSANPGVLEALSRGYATGLYGEDAVRQMAGDAVQSDLENATTPPPQNKDEWFDPIKTASRYLFAGLNLTNDLTQNAGSALAMGLSYANAPGMQGYEPGTRGLGGWFISTDLGSLIANDEVAGDGWFIGGQAKELQAQRAREFRGTLVAPDGSEHAWTFGRQLSSVLFQPDHDANAIANGLESVAYNVVAGLTDAYVAMKVPAVPGGQALKTVTSEITGLTGLRSVGALSDFNSVAINPTRVTEWLSSRTGRKVIDYLAEDVTTVEKAMSIFPDADARWWKTIIDADTPEKVEESLRRGLRLADPEVGLAPRTLQGFKVGYWNGAKYRINQMESWVPRYWTKLMAPVYGQDVFLAFGSQREVAQSLKNIDNSLIAFGVRGAKRELIMKEWLDAYVNNPAGLGDLALQYRNHMGLILGNVGVPQKAFDQMFEQWRDFTNRIQQGATDIQGNQIIGQNFGRQMIDIDGNLIDLPTSTAGMISEVAKHTLTLPDPRRVRRIMTNKVNKAVFGKITKNGQEGGWFDPANYGKQRLPWTLLEGVFQGVWRPLTLMTGGYITRNTLDSIIRSSMSHDVKNGIMHPWEYMTVAMHGRLKGDIEGVEFSVKAQDAFFDGRAEFGEAVNTSLRELDPVARARQERWTGQWGFAPRGNTKEYQQGIADEVQLLASDPLFRKVAEGLTPEEIKTWLTTTDEGQRHLRALQTMWTNVVLQPQAGGARRVVTVDFLGPNQEANIMEYIGYATDRVNSTVGNSKVLRDVVKEGKFDDGTGKLVDAFRRTQNGAFYGHTDEFMDQVRRISQDPSAGLRDLYKHRIYLKKGRFSGETGNAALDSSVKAWNGLTRFFFGTLYGKSESFLNRSPAFRQFYYQEIKLFINDLAPGEAQKIIDNISQAAKRANKTYDAKYLAAYVGDKKLAETLTGMAKGEIAETGTRTYQEISGIAKGYALDSTHDLFYNAAERSNFADIMRIIVPFGTAWGEVMRNYTKRLATNPNTLRRAQVSVQSLTEADPEQDGKGFFWRDPNNGQYYFSVPFVGDLIPFISPGVRPEIIAPAKSLSMGLSFLPGFGPLVQVAAEKLLGKYPQFDWVRKFFNPYGTTDLNIVPAYAQKLWSAFQADPKNDTVFASMFFDTLRALGSSGKYDLSKETEIKRLEDDATETTRALLVFRAIGQFMGPARPEVDFVVDTKEGDVMAAELSRAFYKMREEDWTTAVQQFITTFGDDVFLYMASKTRSTVPGLEATEEFGNWERTHGGFLDTYDQVGSYFAPGGSTFDFQVWLRQMATGKREYPSADEMIAMAQEIVGKALVRDARSKMPADPTDEQKEWLSNTIKSVEEMYPGYANRVIDVNQTDRMLNQLEPAARDPRMDDNMTALAVRTYLDWRNSFMQQAEAIGRKGLGSNDMAYARAELRGLATKLIAEVPEFSRVYDQILAYEVED